MNIKKFIKTIYEFMPPNNDSVFEKAMFVVLALEGVAMLICLIYAIFTYDWAIKL